MFNILITIILSVSITYSFAQGLSSSRSRGETLNGRISPGGSFSATDEDGNFVNGHVSPGGHLQATDSNGNFINGNISPSGFFSGTDSNGNFLNGKVRNQDDDMLNTGPHGNDAARNSIYPTDAIEFRPEDKLDKALRAVQILDTLDVMDRRGQQSALQQQQLDLDKRRLESLKEYEQRRATIEEREFNLQKQRLERMQRDQERLNEQWKLDQWKESRAREALSYAAAELYKIDLMSPDGEKKLNDWIEYARANGVSEDSLQIIFGGKIRERNLNNNLRYKLLCDSLGEDGMILYEAFLKQGVSPDQASLLAKRSKKAKKILDHLQKLALAHGITFEIPIEEMDRIKKRVGQEAGFVNPISGKYLDTSIYYWDFESLLAAFNTHASQQLKELYAKNPLDDE